jgi:hypothetical protein
MICFFAFAAEEKRDLDWADESARCFCRQCPQCLCHSIIGHGYRRKQAHDDSHDWIRIRRGLCKLCSKTITFLPRFSLPYTHYSLMARAQAVRRYFTEHFSLEAAAPLVKDPNRVASGSTVARWFHRLESLHKSLCPQPSGPPAAVPSHPGSIPPGPQATFPVLRTVLSVLSACLAGRQTLSSGRCGLSWRTLAPYLQVQLPLRL